MQARSKLTAIALAIAPCSAFGFSDFDGDGRSDILWRNDSTGANAIWRSANSATPQTMTAVTNLAWKVVGVGDFDGDGRSDILWRNDSSGPNAIWRSGNLATPQTIAAGHQPGLEGGRCRRF